MNKQIYICGCSGVGKSTLAKYIADYYGIPFVTTSTKPLWKQFGVTNHQELVKLTAQYPERGVEFQWQLLKYRETILMGNKEFVTDRSPIDNIVYFLVQNSMYTTQTETENYIRVALKTLINFSHFIYISWSPDIELEDDGMRVNNLHYQVAMDSVFYSTIHMYLKDFIMVHKKKMLTLDNFEFEDRKKKVKAYISNLIL